MIVEGKGWTMYHGDCLEVMPTLGKVDAVVTDPPYAISLAGVSHVGQPGRGARRLDFFEGDSDWSATIRMALDMATIAMGLLSDVGSFYAWCGHRQFGPLVSLFEGAGWKTRFLVWAKTAPPPPPPGSGWPSGAELCVYAFRPGRTWNHSGSNPPPNNVFTHDSFRFGQPGKVDHPTQKPLAVIEPIVAASTMPGETILDPFAGSGTTGVACLRLGRQFIGIEKDPTYFKLACDRLRAEEQGSTLQAARAGQEALFK